MPAMTIEPYKNYLKVFRSYAKARMTSKNSTAVLKLRL
jgi:hypothetical protein